MPLHEAQHVVTARGRRSGVTLLPSGLIGIPLACRIGSAIDGGESLRKSASLVNFGGVVFVPTSKFLLLSPLWTCWCKKIDVGRGVQRLRKNNGFSGLAHGPVMVFSICVHILIVSVQDLRLAPICRMIGFPFVFYLYHPLCPSSICL